MFFFSFFFIPYFIHFHLQPVSPFDLFASAFHPSPFVHHALSLSALFQDVVDRRVSLESCCRGHLYPLNESLETGVFPEKADFLVHLERSVSLAYPEFQVWNDGTTSLLLYPAHITVSTVSIINLRHEAGNQKSLT